MRVFFSAALALVLLIGGSVAPTSAQSALTKRDGQGPVAVVVTLMEATASGIRAKVVLDTHSVALDGIAFEQAVRLRRPDGTEIAPVAVEGASGAGHHRQAVVVFPPVGGATAVLIVVKDVGGIAERAFRWALPLQ